MTSVPRVTGRSVFFDEVNMPLTGGVAALDAQCTKDATSYGVTGTYLALVATTTASAGSRLPNDGLPWIRLDGVPIANGTSDLLGAGGPALLAPLDLDVRGQPNTELVATGAHDFTSVGTPASTCQNYTDASTATGRIVGDASFPDQRMVDAGLASSSQCNFGTAFYCFQE
jgi:hypothetical protein